jgi:hypothetical protein
MDKDVSTTYKVNTYTVPNLGGSLRVVSIGTVEARSQHEVTISSLEVENANYDIVTEARNRSGKLMTRHVEDILFYLSAREFYLDCDRVLTGLRDSFWKRLVFLFTGNIPW